MIKKLFSFFAVSLVVGFSCLPACAEEVELIPEDSFELYSSSPYNNQLIQEVEKLASGLSATNNAKYILGYDSVADSTYLYSSSGYSSGFLDMVHTGMANNIADWSMSYNNLIITLDMSNNTDGFYRYGCDFYFGVAGGFSQYANVSGITIDLTPGYTYNSVPLSIADSSSGMHCTVFLIGEVDYNYSDRNTNSSSYAIEQYSLIHAYMESTFYYDSQYGTDVVFNLQPWFQNNISSLSIDCSGLRSTVSRSFYFYANNRVKSSLYGNVAPPVTPTPSPTPYPGQDTQESINQGVQIIVNALDISATPIPTPADLEIDETIFETMTLPDVSSTQATFTSLWAIFDPLWTFIALLAGSLLVVGIFCYILRGGFI